MSQNKNMLKADEADLREQVYGDRKSRISANDLALMGKGPVARLKAIPCKPYLGATGGQLWDPEQSKLNKELGYWDGR